MNIFHKMMTVARSVGREAGEDFVDANGLRIFEQEILDCDQGIKEAKHNLSRVTAQRLKLEREKQVLEKKCKVREQQTRDALALGKDEIALEIAEVIADQEKRLSDYNTNIEKLKANEVALNRILKKSIKQINEYQHELIIVKATDSAQQATTSLGNQANRVGSKIQNMQESLERIKAKQEQIADVDTAWELIEDRFSNRSLDEKLKDEGITKPELDATIILDRIKKGVN